MAYQANSQLLYKGELSHKQIVMQQILICNKLFSGFEGTPDLADEKLRRYDYTNQAQQSKSILLGVITLENNARSILPEAYQERVRPYKEKLNRTITYTDPLTHKPVTTYKFLSSDPTIQLDGLIEISDYYRELLAAIFSTKNFSDIIMRHQMIVDEGMVEDEVFDKEDLFDTEKKAGE